MKKLIILLIFLVCCSFQGKDNKLSYGQMFYNISTQSYKAGYVDALSNVLLNSNDSVTLNKQFSKSYKDFCDKMKKATQ